MKKTIVVIAMAHGVFLAREPAIAQEAFKIVDTIAGTNLKFVESAVPEFMRYGLKLDRYRILVIKREGRNVVVFRDLNTPSTQRGSTRENPSIEVELSDDGAVVRSYIAQ